MFGREKKAFSAKQKEELGFNVGSCNTNRVGYVRCIVGRITLGCATRY